jgi:hypothetical protein
MIARADLKFNFIITRKCFKSQYWCTNKSNGYKNNVSINETTEDGFVLIGRFIWWRCNDK